MYIPRYPTFWPKYFFKQKSLNVPFPLNQESFFLHRSGTEAIAHAINILKLSRGEKVLVPSYTCINTVEPFRRNEIDVVFYKINKDLSIDKDDVEAKLKKGASALLFIHYFGFPQNLPYLSALKKRFEIQLIEDCAHAFLSDLDGLPLGTLGDVSIFSLRKIVPLNNSGILMVNNQDLIVSKCQKVINSSVSFIKGCIFRLIENIKFRSGLSFVVKQSIADEKKIDPISSLRELTINSDCICPSSLHKRMLHSLDYSSIKEKRRDNFRVLLAWALNRADVKPLFDELPEGVNCLAFPIFTEKSNKVCKTLNISGIDAFPWPHLPEGTKIEDYNATHLAQNVVLLPIHQDLRTKHIDHIINSLNSSLLN
jgi:perosamine synthetase